MNELEKLNIDAIPPISEEKEKAILHQAILEYGRIPQMDMCVEEMAELIKAINKYKRAYYKLGKYANEPTMPVDIYDNVVEEIADVKIMIKQMEKMFGESNVEEEYRYKMNRLGENLKIIEKEGENNV